MIGWIHFFDSVYCKSSQSSIYAKIPSISNNELYENERLENSQKSQNSENDSVFDESSNYYSQVQRPPQPPSRNQSMPRYNPIFIIVSTKNPLL